MSQDLELLKRFTTEFAEEFLHDPLFYRITEALKNGVSPYQIIEDVSREYKRLSADYTKLLLEGPAPKYLVVTQERFDEIEKTGKL